MRLHRNPPNDWNIGSLGKLATVQAGGTPSRKEPRFWGGSVPWVGTGEIDFNEIVSGTESITKLGLESSSARMFPAGTILMAMIGQGVTRGKVARLGIDAATNQNCVGIIPKDGLQHSFLFYFLASRYSAIRTFGNAGGISNLNASLIKEIQVPLPPGGEQRRIAEILSTWDQAIELTEKLIAAKQKRKQALMQQLLTGKVRFPEFTEPWLDSPLGDFVHEVRRTIDWNDEKLYRLASIRRHSQGMFDREALFGHQIKVKKLNHVHKGDFLISNIQAAYGAMGLVSDSFHNAYISDQYTVLVPNDCHEFDIRFLGYLSETAWFRYQIVRACNGFFAERLRLLFYADELLKRKIPAPPTIEEQSRIADTLDTAVAEIRLAERKLEALQNQKKGLMQQLLTGKTRVNVPEEEQIPAESA